MKFKPLAIVPLLILAGCNQSSTGTYVPEKIKIVNATEAAAPTDQNLFPLVRGNQWVYDVTSNITVGGKPSRNDSTEMTFRCTNVYRQGAKTYATLEAVARGQVNERQQWIVEDGKGVFQASVGDPAKPFTPPQPALRFPVKEGVEFKWEGTGFVPEGMVTSALTTSKVEASQEVDTGAGRMKAIPILTFIKWSTGQAAQTTWWAPGVGIARYRQEVVAIRSMTQNGKTVKEQAVAVQTMRLKSMTLKKASE